MESRRRISVKGRNGKDKWKDKMRWDLRGRAGEQKAEAPSGTTEAKSSLFVVGGVSEAVTNSAPPVQLGGVDTADFIAEKQ